jgi:DNA invertase Pin-like site-specific DNA recombinase
MSSPKAPAVPQTPPAAPPSAPDPAPPLRSAKIQERHLDRLAVVYVRQSSPHQVVHNRESRERQYALVGHAVALGWPRERVLVIDEDQGQSGKDAVQRSGFHRLLAEVAMEHVGLILGLEMSRLARSSKDWHHLLEMCALVGTVLGDEDGVYDPHDVNDRLLLGLKGTISEFELVTMRNRLERGKLNKAQRGELFYGVPAGYVRLTPEQVALDPDEQVRGVIDLIFDKFDELGTIWGVFRYLVAHRLRLGMRAQAGPHRGEVQWRRPRYASVRQILHLPIYAGVYAYGRRQRRRRGAGGEPLGVDSLARPEGWNVFQRDRLPAYISWERYVANQERIRQNRNLPDTQGAPRQGAALLSGLIGCGHCGCRLHTHHGRRRHPSYRCERGFQKGHASACGSLGIREVDDLVARQVLRALEPAALELSVQALEQSARERGRLERHWQQRRERARYESEAAERRYRAVDPANRLVARTLEGQWEAALANERALAEEYDRFRRETPPCLSPQERERIQQLASDIPRLWQAPGTTAADRKAIIRLLVTRVVVSPRPDSEYVEVVIHWHGGYSSRHEVARAVRSYRQQRDYDRLLDRVVALWEAHVAAPEIARRLNAEGFVPPQRRCAYSGFLVRQLLCRRGYGPDQKAALPLGRGEWLLADLAEELGVPAWKLRLWGQYGWLHYRRTPMRKLFVAWADAAELRRLRKLAAHSKHGRNAHPSELTTPKKRENEGG